MKWFTNRYNQICVTVFALMILLVLRLFVLTVVQGEKWAEAAESISTKTVFTSAPRGEIMDRYGRLLAGNESSFTAQFSDSNLSVEEINRQALEVVNLLLGTGDQLNDNLPIILRADGTFSYTYQETIENWLASQGMPVTFTAEQAFEELRQRYGVDEGLDKYDAQTDLQTVYGVYPPISVRNMQFTEDLNKQNFLGRYQLDYDTINKDLTAEEAFRQLRKKFEISKDLSDADARKIMMVRNELAARGYYSYMPVDVAQELSDQAVVTLEERSTDLSGVQVSAESIRYYPNGTTASHVLGYLGKISESNKSQYLEKGYNVSDLVGQEGVEKSFEDILRGTDGQKEVEVNTHGELVRTISETPASKGQDIYLTIDLELQKTAEAALSETLTKMQSGGTFQGEYGTYKYKTYPYANVGALVALEVDTGDVLALASNPSFDPNLFATGISSEDWDSLQPVNARDSLAPRPLYNTATMTAVQPGSTFKMITGIAALESGLDPNKKLRDGGAVKLGERTYGCVVWNMNRSNHGYLNLYQALEVSCNYYFYDLAVGRDWYTGKSLGFSPPMDIKRITDYAQQFGLGKATGIEIAETVRSVPTEEQKINGTKAQLKNVLLGRAEMYFEESVVADKTLLAKNIDTIVGWTDENPSFKEVMRRMENVGVKEDMIYTVANLCKFTYFNFAKWTVGDELNISIGQGENQYTPVQLANYIATIGNGGTLNKVNLLRATEAGGVEEKEAGTKVQLSDPSHLDDIIEGMRLVAHGSRGGARTVFSNFPIQVAVKTGTAQRAGKVPAADEVEYVKENLHRINASLTWEEVEAEMERLLKEYPELYTTRDGASHQAVINLSRDKKITDTQINAYKRGYEDFAWFVAMAPADDPKIAVAVLIFQGGSGVYAAPAAREVIGKYLELNKTYEDYNLETKITQ